MKRFLLCLILFIPTLCAGQDTSSEKILLFSSNIIVNKDNSLDITETISVYTNRGQLEHGLTRALPIKFPDSMPSPIHYDVKQVLVNNALSPYRTETKDGFVLISIGSTNATLAPGIYVYTIQYHADRVVTNSALQWDVTGHQWEMPIFKVEADVLLPEGVNISQYAGYTGKLGSQMKDIIATQTKPNKVSFASKQAFYPGNGLTINIDWKKAPISN